MSRIDSLRALHEAVKAGMLERRNGKSVLDRRRRDTPHKASCHFCNYSVIKPCTEADHVKNCENY